MFIPTINSLTSLVKINLAVFHFSAELRIPYLHFVLVKRVIREQLC